MSFHLIVLEEFYIFLPMIQDLGSFWFAEIIKAFIFLQTQSSNFCFQFQDAFFSFQTTSENHFISAFLLILVSLVWVLSSLFLMLFSLFSVHLLINLKLSNLLQSFKLFICFLSFLLFIYFNQCFFLHYWLIYYLKSCLNYHYFEYYSKKCLQLINFLNHFILFQYQLFLFSIFHITLKIYQAILSKFRNSAINLKTLFKVLNLLIVFHLYFLVQIL